MNVFAAAPTVKTTTATDVRQDGTSTGPHNYVPPVTGKEYYLLRPMLLHTQV